MTMPRRALCALSRVIPDSALPHLPGTHDRRDSLSHPVEDVQLLAEAQPRAFLPPSRLPGKYLSDVGKLIALGHAASLTQRVSLSSLQIELSPRRHQVVALQDCFEPIELDGPLIEKGFDPRQILQAPNLDRGRDDVFGSQDTRPDR